MNFLLALSLSFFSAFFPQVTQDGTDDDDGLPDNLAYTAHISHCKTRKIRCNHTRVEREREPRTGRRSFCLRAKKGTDKNDSARNEVLNATWEVPSWTVLCRLLGRNNSDK